VEVIKDLSNGGVDVVFECAGVPATVSQCFQLVRRGGRVVLFGVNDPETRVAFSPYQVFRNEITVLGSLMANDAFPRTLGLLASGKLAVQPLISHIMPLDRFLEALDMHQRQEGLKILVSPMED
jgi:threonine dehydrogenase-like Zn-dependent dehydrogenase